MAYRLSRLSSKSFAPATASTVAAFKPLKIGAGGFVTGIDIIRSDNTKVIRCDSYGAYLYNDTAPNPGNAGGLGVWVPLITSQTMPAAFVTISDSTIRGCMELRIAPSNTNRFYMLYLGKMFVSTNRGANWANLPNFTTVGGTSNDTNRLFGYFMAVDPANELVCYVGSESTGVQVTTDGGGTWSAVSAVGNATSSAWNLIAFDPSSSVVGGKTQGIYISTYGTGVYQSTNGGTSWTLTTGTPTTHRHMIVDSAGKVWLSADTGTQNLWTFSSGTWSNITTSAGQGNRCWCIAIDPNNSNNIMIGIDSGDIISSTNGGTAWNTPNFNNTRTATDIPWLAWTNESYMSASNMVYDSASKLWFSEGIGVWTTTNPGNNAVSWISTSAGIENLTAHEIVSPWGLSNVPILMAGDRPLFRVTDITKYPSTHGLNNTNSIEYGAGVDWAANSPLNMVALVTTEFGLGTFQASSSTNGGAAWTAFSGSPATQTEGGSIAIAATTLNSIVRQQSLNGDPYYTTDGGATWTKITITGVPASPSTTGWGFNLNDPKRLLTSDKVNDQTFYMYNYGPAGAPSAVGTYKSTDGGATWTHVNTTNLATGYQFQLQLRSVPNNAGHLFFTPGGQLSSSHPATSSFYRSTDAGTTWTAIANVTEVFSFGFGLHAPGQSYPAIYIYGWVNNVGGVWRSIDNASSWTQLSGLFPINSLDLLLYVEGDANIYGRCYLSFFGSGYAYGDFP